MFLYDNKNNNNDWSHERIKYIGIDKDEQKINENLLQHFDNLKFYAGNNINKRANILLDHTIWMDIDFGCLFEPINKNDLSQVHHRCNNIDKPSMYDKYCTEKNIHQIGWTFNYVESSYHYDATRDKTTFVYAVDVKKNALDSINKVRLQLPCDCLLSSCDLDQLTFDINGDTTIVNGMYVLTSKITKDNIRLWSITMNGHVPVSNGKFALYGDKFCGSAVTKVPQPCSCWSDWSQYSECDVSCGTGSQFQTRKCTKKCPFYDRSNEHPSM